MRDFIKLTPPPKMKTFLFGMCSESHLHVLIAQAEEDGCELFQVLPMQMTVPAQRSTLDIGRAGNPMEQMTVYRLVVRLPEAEFPAFEKKITDRQKQVQVVPGMPGVH